MPQAGEGSLEIGFAWENFQVGVQLTTQEDSCPTDMMTLSWTADQLGMGIESPVQFLSLSLIFTFPGLNLDAEPLILQLVAPDSMALSSFQGRDLHSLRLLIPFLSVLLTAYSQMMGCCH